MAVNVTGCVVGVLGGFTTFSDTVAAYRAGASTLAAVNVVASVGLCLVAVWLGGASGAVAR